MLPSLTWAPLGASSAGPTEGLPEAPKGAIEAREGAEGGLPVETPLLKPLPALSPPAPEVDRPPPPEVGRGQLTPAGTAGGAPAAWVPGHCDPRTAPPEEPWGQLAPKDPWGSQTTVVM